MVATIATMAVIGCPRITLLPPSIIVTLTRAAAGRGAMKTVSRMPPDVVELLRN
jgi:hypothetical protein